MSKHNNNPPYNLLAGLLVPSLLTACPAPGVGNAPVSPPATGVGASALPSATPGASANPSDNTGSASTPLTPNASATPSANASAPVNGGVNTGGSVNVSLPANLSSIRFATIDRFLDAKGEATRYQVELVDSLGNLIPVEVPLEWSSSRLQDFSVDANGNIKALVDFGYSTIEVKIPGTAFEARTVVNVTSPSSGGGSGGGSGASGGGGVTGAVNTAPVIQSLQASSTTVNGAAVPIKLTASATDAESQLTAGSYSWSCADPACNAQFDTRTGTSVFWRSPATAGAYALKLTVTDGNLSSSREITLNVQTGQGQLVINPVG